MKAYPKIDLEVTDWFFKRRPRPNKKSLKDFLCFLTGKEYSTVKNPWRAKVVLEIPVSYPVNLQKVYNLAVGDYILLGVRIHETVPGVGNTSLLIVADCDSWFKRN